MEDQHLRYPIGSFTPLNKITDEERTKYGVEIGAVVPNLQNTIADLEHSQLHTPYREQGWTILQVIHHMADNDMNAYIRLKRALTEKKPQASSYREDLWAELNDYKETPVSISLHLLESIHYRLIKVLAGMRPQDFERTLTTQALGLITVDTAIQRFIWHNKHHTAQIQGLIRRLKKFE